MVEIKVNREAVVSSVAFVDMMADRGGIKGKELLEVGIMRRDLMAAIQTHDIEMKAAKLKEEALKEEYWKRREKEIEDDDSILDQ